MTSASALEIFVDGHFSLGESPVYDDQTNELLWTDLTEGTIYALDLAGLARRAWRFGEPVGCFGLTDKGNLVVGLRHTVVIFNRETGNRRTLATLPHPHSEIRSNDGKVGPDGTFWVSTMDDRAIKEPIGAVFRVTGDGQVEEKISNLKISNGLAWTADGRTMFHTDTRGPWIDRWDFDPKSGAISGQTRIRMLDDEIGRPDGGACDLDGNYWSAGISAARINCFSPQGELLASLKSPLPRPTMPCFAGKDWRTLIVTTASQGLSSEVLAAHPGAGALLKAKVAVAGVPAFRFREQG